MKIRLILAVLLLSHFLSSLTHAQSVPGTASLGPDVQTIAFLGDSNTYAGRYIAIVEAGLREAKLQPMPEVLNLGLPSETASGLSEIDHPFPRPCVHERLQRTLDQVAPDLVFVCYGVNDGIYAPADKDRMMAYTDAMMRLVDAVQASGARCIVMTPPAFDALPMRKSGKLQPAGLAMESYSFKAIYEDYDDVLASYSEWLKQSLKRDVPVIDLHSPMRQHLVSKRLIDPQFTMSGDGIHFDAEGHQIIAREIMEHLELDADAISAATELPDAEIKTIHKRQQVMRDAWLTQIGHLRPGMKKGLPLSEARQQK